MMAQSASVWTQDGTHAMRVSRHACDTAFEIGGVV
jgi:hypothetical protein